MRTRKWFMLLVDDVREMFALAGVAGVVLAGVVLVLLEMLAVLAL